MCGVRCTHAPTDPKCRCWGIYAAVPPSPPEFVEESIAHAVFPGPERTAFGNRLAAEQAAFDANKRGRVYYRVCQPEVKV
jgi:hypothetical protein